MHCHQRSSPCHTVPCDHRYRRTSTDIQPSAIPCLAPLPCHCHERSSQSHRLPCMYREHCAATNVQPSVILTLPCTVTVTFSCPRAISYPVCTVSIALPLTFNPVLYVTLHGYRNIVMCQSHKLPCMYCEHCTATNVQPSVIR